MIQDHVASRIQLICRTPRDNQQLFQMKEMGVHEGSHQKLITRPLILPMAFDSRVKQQIDSYLYH